MEEDVHNWFLHYLLDLLLDGCSDNTTKQYGYNPNPFGDIEIYRDTEDPLIWLCTHYILHEKSNDGQPYGSIFSIFSFSSWSDSITVLHPVSFSLILFSILIMKFLWFHLFYSISPNYFSISLMLTHLDPVARFHLRNGASLHRINWMADTESGGKLPLRTLYWVLIYSGCLID